MFGIYMAIAFIILKGYSLIKKGADEKRRKRNAIKDGQEYYVDRNGTLLRVKDDVPVMRTWIGNDLCEINPYTHEVRRNISSENRIQTEKRNKEKAIQNGDRVYRCEPLRSYNEHYHTNDKIKGIRYKDVETGEIYVIRRKNGKNWYLNINTGYYDFADIKQIKSLKMHYMDKNGNSILSEYNEELLNQEKEWLNLEQKRRMNENPEYLWL